MSESAVIEKTATNGKNPSHDTEVNKPVFECKLPGVWGKVYETKSKEGKPTVFARFRRYRKTGEGYEDNLFINSMTECDNAIEVLYQVKQCMRKFYSERDSE